MKKLMIGSLAFCLILLLTGFTSYLASDPEIAVPKGFKATIVAEKLGAARHIAITPQGVIYIKLSQLKDGKGIVMLADKNNDGKIEKQKSFGNYTGTGIYVKGNHLYASSDQAIFRYTLNEQGEVTNENSPETVVKGLINRHQHESKSIVVDNEDNIYVNIGAYSNACQERDRTKGSKGMMPCPILDSAGGIWQFKANGVEQTYGNGTRYATGLRNVVGLDWNTSVNKLYVMQHGRDQLFQLYPEYFDAKQSAELPSECMFGVSKGDNCGWPYVYYDHLQQKKIMAPEYGGDGKKTGGEDAIDPTIAFPGHMAPNGLLFYTGSQFPERYKNGAFIAFHGSWNRAPEKQKGYFVVFVPFKDGKPSGEWEVFADNFAGVGEIQSPSQAKHRPCGLAQAPDGSLFVTDDVVGSIYKISYKK